MKKFSIVIPNYKKHETLSKCIGSVKDQDYKEKQIIVVMDSRDQESEDILKTFPDVEVIYTVSEKSGAPNARNTGAMIATGDYLLFLDADSYLMPGALTHWAEVFEEKPEIDFVYSGYRIVGAGQPYQSEEFDPYHLETNNYIDTCNPIRRQKAVIWDNTLESLQDWDFWLRVVKNGSKGHYLKNYIYVEKEAPKKGDISDIGTPKYLERKHIVKTKLSLRNSPVCLTSFAAEHHARRVAKLLGFDYVDPIRLGTQEHNYKVIYLIGIFVENAHNFMPFCGHKDGMIKKDLIKVVHWIGTDILHTMTLASFADLKKLVEPYNNKLIQLCQTKENYEELTSMGFKTTIMPLPIDVKSPLEIAPYPKKFTVAIYDHGTSNEDIYNQVLMNELIKAMPDIQFLYFGSNMMVGDEKNVKFLGKVKIEDVITQSSCLLRITKHDGFPVTPIEFLNHNRITITNVNMPYMKIVNVPKDYNSDNFPEVKKTLIRAIREEKKLQTSKSYFVEAREYYSDLLNPKKLRDYLINLIK